MLITSHFDRSKVKTKNGRRLKDSEDCRESSKKAKTSQTKLYEDTEASLQAYSMAKLRKMFASYEKGYSMKSTKDYRLSILRDGWRLDENKKKYVNHINSVFGSRLVEVHLL